MWSASIVGADIGQRKGEPMSILIKGMDLPIILEEDEENSNHGIE